MPCPLFKHCHGWRRHIYMNQCTKWVKKPFQFFSETKAYWLQPAAPNKNSETPPRDAIVSTWLNASTALCTAALVTVNCRFTLIVFHKITHEVSATVSQDYHLARPHLLIPLNLFTTSPPNKTSGVSLSYSQQLEEKDLEVLRLTVRSITYYWVWALKYKPFAQSFVLHGWNHITENTVWTTGASSVRPHEVKLRIYTLLCILIDLSMNKSQQHIDLSTSCLMADPIKSNPPPSSPCRQPSHPTTPPLLLRHHTEWRTEHRASSAAMAMTRWMWNGEKKQARCQQRASEQDYKTPRSERRAVPSGTTLVPRVSRDNGLNLSWRQTPV